MMVEVIATIDNERRLAIAVFQDNICRIIITLEFALAFFVPAMFLALGALAELSFIIPFFIKPNLPMFITIVLMTVGILGGSLGLWAATQLFCKILSPELIIGSPRKLFYFILIGNLTIIIYLSLMGGYFPSYFIYLLSLPIPVSVHLIYLNRHYLWPDNKENKLYHNDK